MVDIRRHQTVLCLAPGHAGMGSAGCLVVNHDHRRRKQAEIRQAQVIHGRSGKSFNDVF